MEVKFLWIEEYGNIKSTGFNFANSDGNHFIYENDSLIVHNNTGFFDGSNYANNISSITAICGKNGAGKSSLIEIVLANTAHIDNSTYTQLFRMKSIIVLGNHISYHEELELKNEEELRSKGFIVNNYSHVPFERGYRYMGEHVQDIAFISYSNYLYNGFYYDLPNLF